MGSTARRYGAAIAIASGAYAVWSGTGAVEMTSAAWLMLLLGIVVVIHGVVLLTPAADRLGGASGPLMVVYAAVMLLAQFRGGAPMRGGMGTDSGMGAPAPTTMGWDPGMVALALLMLASGLIMLRDAGRTDRAEM